MSIMGANMHQSQANNIDKRQDASLPNNNCIIVGTSGSGKSAFMRGELKKISKVQKVTRIIAWDPDEDYKIARVRDMKTFQKVCQKAGFGKVRVALTVAPNEENFEMFAAIVFAMCHCKAPLVCIADEIADVTRIAKASPHWGELCRKIRKYGGTLYALTQRPQECDKTIFNQVKFKWCGALGSHKSYKHMAEELDLKLVDIKQLENIEKKQVEYWFREGVKGTEKYRMTFSPHKTIKLQKNIN